MEQIIFLILQVRDLECLLVDSIEQICPRARIYLTVMLLSDSSTQKLYLATDN